MDYEYNPADFESDEEELYDENEDFIEEEEAYSSDDDDETEQSPPCAFPYDVVGTVLLNANKKAVLGPSGKYKGTIAAMATFQNRWRRIVEDALNTHYKERAWVARSANPQAPIVMAEDNQEQPADVFEVHFAGETALGLLTMECPLSFYVSYSPMIINNVINKLIVRQLVGFDIEDARDGSTNAGDVVLNYIHRLRETHGDSMEETYRKFYGGKGKHKSSAAYAFDMADDDPCFNVNDGVNRDAVTVVSDRREGIVAFVVRGVTVLPPGEKFVPEPEDEVLFEDQGEKTLTPVTEMPKPKIKLLKKKKNNGDAVVAATVTPEVAKAATVNALKRNILPTRGGVELPRFNGQTPRRRISLRILLPAGNGEAVHKDTAIVMQAVADHPFLLESLQGAILWATAQRFYLNEEAFQSLNRTRAEVAFKINDAIDTLLPTGVVRFFRGFQKGQISPWGFTKQKLTILAPEGRFCTHFLRSI